MVLPRFVTLLPVPEYAHKRQVADGGLSIELVSMAKTAVAGSSPGADEAEGPEAERGQGPRQRWKRARLLTAAPEPRGAAKHPHQKTAAVAPVPAKAVAV